jgi:hypothetical protein
MILFLPDIHEKLFIRFKGNPIHKLFQDIVVDVGWKLEEDDYSWRSDNDTKYCQYYNDMRKLKIQKVNKFRFLYYSLKFKNKFRDWLWKKVREPKIQQQYHPSRLLELLKDKDSNNIDEELLNKF